MDRDSSVAGVIADVRTRGDAAVAEWSRFFDGTTADRPERATAGLGLPTDAVLTAADAVRRWHERQRPADITFEVNPGVVLERRWVPVRTVGVYVPTRLVSSLIMTAVPARVAGVEKIVVCTPPKGSELVAAAAALLNVDEVWAVGGVQAIAAMAYGTESICRVDKVVGPGGAAVNAAKLLVSQDVAIDLPAGPSDIVVVADPGVDERLVQLELAAQMEHGPDSKGVVVRVRDDLAATLREIDDLAGEHVVLLGARAESLASAISNAGTIFVGPYAPSPLGDYATGANHVLPTGGRAVSSGGLGLETFLKPVTVQRVSAAGLAGVAPTAIALAELEGLSAHRRAVVR
jgi:histidinol dehydrogenase